MKPTDIALVELKNIFSDRCLTDSESLSFYGKDWTTYFDIAASAVVFPLTTDEVVKLVQWGRNHKIALVPSGGRTGLSGAAVATQGEVIVSFEKMNKILDFNPVDATVCVQPGVILEDLQNFAHQKNLFYPVDFAARGSAHVAGSIATNAGGIRVVRYGVTRQWVAGLTVVTGKGEVLKLNNSLIKNNTGFDLRQLFIGSEGTLGFITEATMQLTSMPAPAKVVLLALPDLSSVMQVFAEFRKTCLVNAFEMFSDKALNKVLEGTGLAAPFASVSPFYVVTEIDSPSEIQESKILESFEKCLESGWVTDGALASSEEQAKTFWRYREDISENLAKYSPYKNDISVRISRVPEFLQNLDAILAKSYPQWEVIWFGHIGDGNLHINILRPQGMNKEDFVQECRKVDKIIFEQIEKTQGSISAEHGVGLTKKPFLTYTRSQKEIDHMREIKKSFDPDQILNPGKIFD